MTGQDVVIQLDGPTMVLPPDPFWPRRVHVEGEQGACVPFHIMLLWHWQFFTENGPGAGTLEEAAA